ncbi:hypothetical protein [Streptomyces nodosus]|uniref:hypothetical protein n=1 Tax=Streptomyces nodosus TaxID=40318 RepID=UPI0038101434
MKMTVEQPAGDGERFAPDAFDSQVGQEVPVKTPDGTKTGRVTGARVAADGQSVEIELDVPGLTLPGGQGGSFGLR